MPTSATASETPNLLIDDQGEVIDSRSIRLRANLNALQAGDAFHDYAIRNLGFVGVQANRGRLHIRLRPSHVSPVAFAGLMYWLADKQPERVMLSKLEAGAWAHELLGSSAAAAPRLARIVNDAQCKRRGDLLARARDIETLAAEHPLKQLHAARADLQDALERNDIGGLLDLVSAHVGGRHSMSRADPALKRIVITSIGDGFASEARYWLGRVVGHRMDDIPDAAYGRWCAEVYGEAIRLATAQLHDLDVIVEWPGEGRKRYRTTRLLLPLRETSGHHVVLSATLPDLGIDLRSETA
jgi:hypothetical protein